MKLQVAFLSVLFMTICALESSNFNTVQGIYFVESDVEFRADQEAAIGTQLRNLQEKWLDQFNETFRIADPAVEVINGDEDQFWYVDTPLDGVENPLDFRARNMEAEIMRKLEYTLDTPIRVVVFPVSIHDGFTKATGPVEGSTEGFSGAFMDGDDIECIITGGDTFPQEHTEFPPSTCIGHVAHELGHLFGLLHLGPPNDCMVDTGLFDLENPCIFGEGNRAKVVRTEQSWLTLDSLPGGTGAAGPATPAESATPAEPAAATEPTTTA